MNILRLKKLPAHHPKCVKAKDIFDLFNYDYF